ncbi:MAG: TldD/PmbA family protein [Candidatus Micrarchaeota archaeon]
MDLDLADYSVKRACSLGASYAEARLIKGSSNGFLLKNGIPELSGFHEETGIAVRLLVNGALGFFSSNKLSRSALGKEVETAVNAAQKVSRKKSAKIEFARERAEQKSYSAKEKISLSSVDEREQFEELQEVYSLLKDSNAGVSSSYLSLGVGKEEKFYANSEGSAIASSLPLVSMFYLLTISSKGETIQRHREFSATRGWEAVREWKLAETIASEALRLRANLEKGKQTPKEKLDVIAAPEVVGIAVHESTGHPYESDRIMGREAAQAGESFVTRKMLNSRIGSECVSVIDDPLIEGSAGFYLFDDEGVKARPRILMKDGKINEFLLNREYACELKLKSNASARASSYAREPLVRMANTYMKPGDYSLEELLSGVKRGIYVKSFMEWNIDDKRMNQKYVGNEAYMIERGEICEPIKKPILEITTPAFYSSIDAVSDKVEFFAGECGKGEPMQGIPVWMGGPHARLRKILVK